MSKNGMLLAWETWIQLQGVVQNSNNLHKRKWLVPEEFHDLVVPFLLHQDTPPLFGVWSFLYVSLAAGTQPPYTDVLQHRSGETGVVFHTNQTIIWADDLGQLWLKSGEGVNKETPQEPPVITAHSFKHSEWYWKMKRIPRWKTGSTIWSTVKPPLPVHSPWQRESIRPGQVNQQQSPKWIQQQGHIAVRVYEEFMKVYEPPLIMAH